MTREALSAELATAVGQANVLTGSDIDERYCTDILRKSRSIPGFVIRPSTTDQLAEVIRLAAAAGVPVTALGGATGLVGGGLAEDGGMLVSLERMNRIVEIDPIAMTVTVEAGVPIQVVQEAVEAQGMILPLDLGSRGSATVGGAISTNAGGTRVLRWGMMREMVLGLEVALADGTIVSALGKTLKDNAGYDWKHIFIGSEGTLGIVTRAVLRLRPAPRSVQTALIATRGIGEAAQILRCLQARFAGRLSSFEMMWRSFYEFVTAVQKRQPLPPNSEMYVLVEALGDDPKYDDESFERALEDLFEQKLIDDAVIAQSERQRDELWAVREDILEPMALLKPRFAYDVSMAISDMERFVSLAETNIRRDLPDSVVMFYGHGGDGNLHVAVGPGAPDPSAEAKANAGVYEAVRAVGGSISAEHGIGRYKKAYIGMSRSPAELELMRKLKRALDPEQLLNPGKVIPEA